LFLSYSKIKRDTTAKNGFNVLLANGEDKEYKGKRDKAKVGSLFPYPFILIPQIITQPS
jgi:hypothetical protein